MKMKIKMFNEDNIFKPMRAHHNDAGADVRSTMDLLLYPGQTYKIPLGFGLELPDGFMAVMMSRSGLAGKGLVSQNAPVDSGYRGQVHAIMTNTSDKIMEINKGDRIAQLVISPILVTEFVEEFETERGTSKFGSTGIK